MLRIDLRSSVPPFEQLRVAIIEQVRIGELAPGSGCRRCESLADSLGIAPNTVARAYRELERAKSSRRGVGRSFIAATGDAVRTTAAYLSGRPSLTSNRPRWSHPRAAEAVWLFPVG